MKSRWIMTLGFLVALSSSMVRAQVQSAPGGSGSSNTEVFQIAPNVGITAEGHLVVDVFRHCSGMKGGEPNACIFRFSDIVIKLVGTEGSSNRFTKLLVGATDPSPQSVDLLPIKSISSNATILGGRFVGLQGYSPDKVNGNTISGCQAGPESILTFNPPLQAFQFSDGCPSSKYMYAFPVTLVLDWTGSVETLRSAVVLTGRHIIAAYQKAALLIKNFSGRISKADRPAFLRLVSGLTEGVNSFRPDDKGRPTVAITHPSVAEGARQIHVRITVLNELIAQYDDIPELSPGIKAMRDLDAAVIAAFGFETGIVGPGSKALSSLAFLIESESRELLGMLAASSETVQNIEIFRKVIRSAQKLRTVVSARSGGDMSADLELSALREAWNSRDWQNVLRQFLNAGPDMSNQVQPRLKLLMMTSESINDLKHFTPEQSFLLPVDSALANREATLKAPEVVGPRK